MIKSNIKIWMFGCIGLLGLNGCNDSFLERYPETSITEDGFFNNASDLEAYTNGLYGNITSGYTDVPSDNMIYTESQNIYSMMRGEVNPDNQSTWDWEKIRDVNFLLSRAGKAQGDIMSVWLVCFVLSYIMIRYCLIRMYLGIVVICRRQIRTCCIKRKIPVRWS